MKTKVIIFFLCMLLLIACTPKEETVKIGALISLTGPAAQFGEASRNGMTLAVDELNAAGGINGKQVEIIFEDDATDPKNAVTAFEKLVNVDNVDAIVGGTWDFNYNAIAPLAEQYQITLVTPQNVKTEGLIVNDYTFVMRPEMRKITATFKDFIKEQGYKKTAMVRFPSAFGQDITLGLQDVMDEVNGELVLEEMYQQIGGNDFLTIILKVKEADPEVVFIDMVGDDIATFMKRVQENDLDVQVLGHGGISDFLANPSVDHSLVTGVVYFDYDKPSAQAFIDKYNERFGRDPTHSADGAYDATIVLAEALSNVEASEVPTYLNSKSFSTINGEFSFKENVIDNRKVFIQEVTEDGVTTLATKVVTI